MSKVVVVAALGAESTVTAVDEEVVEVDIVDDDGV